MEIHKVHSVFFSAAFTTKAIVQGVVKQLHADNIQHDITSSVLIPDLRLGRDELLVVGVPSYSGRVPIQASQQLLRVKGDVSPAMIVCSYGNRDYEDTLVELKDLLTANGFRIVSAAAFIARHSIFRNVASERPDTEDNRIVDDFGCKSWRILSDIRDTSTMPDIKSGATDLIGRYCKCRFTLRGTPRVFRVKSASRDARHVPLRRRTP